MYLIFISYKGGGHYNCACSSPEEVVSYLEQAQAENLKLSATLDEVKNIETDLWTEDGFGNWCTITKASDYSRDEAIKCVPDYFRKAVINMQHYLRESEENHFLEHAGTPFAKFDEEHIYIQALLAEIGLSGYVDISRDVAQALVNLAGKDGDLPFKLMCANVDEANRIQDEDDDYDTPIFTEVYYDDLDGEPVDGNDFLEFPEWWQDFQLWA